jgi:hypothetical protein
MALVVEDGTGLENANSYSDVAYADSYFALRGNTAWAALTTEVKEQSLVKGTDYADQRWAGVIRTAPLNKIQALLLPRLVLVTATMQRVYGIPTAWKKAVCEYALVASTKDLYPVAQTTAKEVKLKEVTVGPIKTKTEYMSAPSSSSFISYPTADNLIRNLFVDSGRVLR